MVQVRSLGWEDPLEEKMATHSSILAGECLGHRSLVGYSPLGHKELDMIERLIRRTQSRSFTKHLEKTHSYFGRFWKQRTQGCGADRDTDFPWGPQATTWEGLDRKWSAR